MARRTGAGDQRTSPNKPSFLHGEFLAGRYTHENGTAASLDDRHFRFVLATAFVHLFPTYADYAVMCKLLHHVTPGGVALITTTAVTTDRRGLEVKFGAGGQSATRWRNHCTYQTFVWLVREAAREVYGVKAPVQPWVIVDPDFPSKLWLDVAVTRPTWSQALDPPVHGGS